MIKNRIDAGVQLAQKLKKYKQTPNTIVLGIPKGGMIVAKSLSRELVLPLDFVLTRKIFIKDYPTYPVGAINANEELIADPQVFENTKKTHRNEIKIAAKKQGQILEYLKSTYKKEQENLDITGKNVILTDEAIVSGMSVLAALQALLHQGPKKIILAIPVAAPNMLASIQKIFKKENIEIVTLYTPLRVFSKALFYDTFEYISHSEAQKCLRTDNQILSDIFTEISGLLDLQNESSFRVEAYSKAARFITTFGQNITDLTHKELVSLPTIGNTIADLIIEYRKTNKVGLLDSIKEKLPQGLKDILDLKSLNLQKTKKLYHQLGIHSLNDLRKAAQIKQIQNIPGFKKDTEEKILAEIDKIKTFDH